MKIMVMILFLLLSHCAHNDIDFNPFTSVVKKILEVNIEK